MIITELSELTPVRQRAVIINFNTRKVAFLALLAALRYAKVPVLVIDCESTDGSYDFFCAQQQRYVFDLVQAPLRTHGLTLDWLFAELPDEQILCVDSDLEILGDEIISFMNRHMDHPEVFGAGFVNGPSFLEGAAFDGTRLEGALFFERPYMPLALFKVARVREALRAGRSFRDELIDNEFARVPTDLLKRVVRKLQKKKLAVPARLVRHRYFSTFPRRVFYDTGGRIYEYLRYERMLFFVNLPEPVHSSYVSHFWGVTRNTIDAHDQNVGTQVKSVADLVDQRLRDAYGEVGE